MRHNPAPPAEPAALHRHEFRLEALDLLVLCVENVSWAHTLTVRGADANGRWLGARRI
jgi:hypothetical protein